MDRIFNAILNNAIKFSVNGGFVHVTLTKEADSVSISIRDPGIGIPEKDTARIFDRFWRSEEFEGRLFGGVGIGLSIAKQVIEQHSGEIVVTSEGKTGTTFLVKLPLGIAAKPEERD